MLNDLIMAGIKRDPQYTPLVGSTVKITRCKQAPKLVGQTGAVQSQHSKTMYVIEFGDGYRRIIRESGFEVTKIERSKLIEPETESTRFERISNTPIKKGMKFKLVKPDAESGAKAGDIVTITSTRNMLSSGHENDYEVIRVGFGNMTWRISRCELDTI